MSEQSVLGKKIIEVLGFLAVVISLVFVGLEIRQNNALARAAAYQSIGLATAEAYLALAYDDEAVRIAYVTPLDSLDEIDWGRSFAEWSAWARLTETLLLQVEQGLLEEDAMDRLGYAEWRTVLENPQFACLWPSIRRTVSPSFIRYIEEGARVNQVDCSAYRLPPRL